MKPRHPHYTQTLKPIVAEEPVDLYLYRPLGFLAARFFNRVSVTPNQVTLLSMLFGIAAGVLYSHGRPGMTALAGLCFFIANAFDCADGQLARLSGIASPTGRILDGAADYVTGIATTLGIAIGYAGTFHPAPLWWGLVAFATVSNVFQSVWVDTYRHRFLAEASGRSNDVEEEYDLYRAYLRKGVSFLDRLLIGAYLGYLRVMMRLSSSDIEVNEEDDLLDEASAETAPRFIRAWMWLGSSTRITLAVIVSFLNRPEWYFLGVAIPFNLFALSLFVWQTLASVRAREAL